MVFKESKFKGDMQRLLYNTARNLADRERRGIKGEKTKAGAGPKPATVTSAAGDAGRQEQDDDDDDEATVVYDSQLQRPSPQLVRQSAVIGKNCNAYDHAKIVIAGGATLTEFREHLQTQMNIWLQSRKDRKAKEKVEELLVLLEGTQDDGPWPDTVEEWKMYLERLPANTM